LPSEGHELHDQGFCFLDQPLNETLYRAWAFRQPGAAEKLKYDLKVRHLMADDDLKARPLMASDGR